MSPGRGRAVPVTRWLYGALLLGRDASMARRSEADGAARIAFTGLGGRRGGDGLRGFSIAAPRRSRPLSASHASMVPPPSPTALPLLCRCCLSDRAGEAVPLLPPLSRRRVAASRAPARRRVTASKASGAITWSVASGRAGVAMATREGGRDYGASAVLRSGDCFIAAPRIPKIKKQRKQNKAFFSVWLERLGLCSAVCCCCAALKLF